MTNYDLEHLQGLIAGGVPVAANQVQFSLLDRRPLDSGMAEWCRANNVGLFTYGSVGGGFLSDRWVVTLRAAVVVVLVVTLVSVDSGQLRLLRRLFRLSAYSEYSATPHRTMQ